ncbi:MAG: hypothetical protein LBH01_06720 [Verrucomicrobiales bacterium]|jgi:hypothetical protein|nr:hypothetical protein [Verrucomicrobiales bacterium]
MAVLAKKISPSNGIYYALPYPRGCWHLYAYRFDQGVELDHSQLWEQYCAAVLAEVWCQTLKQSSHRLKRELTQYVYGCPRGRVACRERAYFINHGGDLPQAIAYREVEQAFGLHRLGARWERDAHEQMLESDYYGIGEVLNLRRTPLT